MTLAPFTPKKLVLPGGTIRYDQFDPSGRAPATTRPLLVFVPGWCGDRLQWHPVCERLQRHGKTCLAADFIDPFDPKAHPYNTIDDLAESIVAFVDKVCLANGNRGRSVYLIGHSMGGRVVADAAARLGKAVRGVVGVEALWDISEDLSDEAVSQRVSEFKKNYRKAAGDYLRSMLPGSEPWHDRIYTSALREDDVSKTRSIGLIASILSNNKRMRAIINDISSKRVLINADGWRSTNDLMKTEYRFDIFPITRAGHYVMIERPAEVAERLNQFVDSTEAEFRAR